MAHRGILANTPKYAGLTNADGTWTGEVRLSPEELEKPLHWEKPRRIAVCFMGDICHPNVLWPWVEHVLEVVNMCPQHTFMFLTKRPERLPEVFYGVGECFDNFWLGVTVCNQQEADEKIPLLLRVPAAKHFISIEPMLAPIDLRKAYPRADYPGCYAQLIAFLDLVIVGAETGHSARPMQPDWARDIIAQCKAAGVPFWYKKGSDGLTTLDGVEWHEMPGGA
jgi:protein gp37